MPLPPNTPAQHPRAFMKQITKTLHRDYSKNAFTLIELLTVVSIILILLSLLLPAFRQIRASATRTGCMANVRTLSQAHTMLATDQGGVLVDYNVSLLFFDYLEPYHGGASDKISVRLCPSANKRASASGGAGSATEAYKWGTGDLGSYGINGFCYSVLKSKTGGSGDGGSANPRSEAAIGWDNSYVYPDMWFMSLGNTKTPSRAPLFLDAMWPDGWPVIQSFGLSSFNIDTPNQGSGWYIERFLVNRHGKRNSVAFLDGNVRSVPLNELWNIQWNALWTNRGIHPSPTLAP